MKSHLLRYVLIMAMVGCISFLSNAQDIITLKKGSRIEAIVTEIKGDVIYYKYFSDPKRQGSFVYTDMVSNITYQNGTVENFNGSENQVPITQTTITQTKVAQSPVKYEEENTDNDSNNSVNTQNVGVNTYQVFTRNDYQDVVYLKNGSVIRGVIIEQIPNKSIKIETNDRNLFAFQMDEIEKITKEPYQSRNRNSFNNSGSSFNNLNNSSGLSVGYKGIVELGYQFSVGDYGMDRLKLNFINGYQFSPYFSLGFGVGLRYYFDSDEALIPFFADFRTNFLDNNISPYFSLGLGYSFDATYNFESVGLLLNPTIGVSLKISDKSAANVGLGYEMQKIKYTSINVGAVSLVVGISF